MKNCPVKFVESGLGFRILSFTLILTGILLLGFSLITSAQKPQTKAPKPTSATQSDHKEDTVIHILNNQYGEFIQSGDQAVQKLMFDVKIRYGSDTLYCDSAFFYSNENSVEAFGDVAVYQADGTTAFADYMRYTGQDANVYMRSNMGDVELSDGDSSTLWSREINYNLRTKKGHYTRGGTLQNGATIITSKVGTYNIKNKDARFKGNVEVSDPDYYVRSVDIGYNTESKVVKFYGKSTVTNESSILQTTSGYYNSADSSSYFTVRTGIWHKDQFIEADTLDYNHGLGVAKAKGRVIAIDTAQKARLYAQKANFYEKRDSTVAWGAPLLKAIRHKDTVYMRADTFISAVIQTSLTSDSDRQKNPTIEQTIQELKAQGETKDSTSQVIANEDSSIVNINLKDSLSDSSILTDIPILHFQDSKDSLAQTKSDSSASTQPIAQQKKEDSKPDTTVLPLFHQPKIDSLSNTYSTNHPSNEDTAQPRYFIGYRQAKVFSDSLKAMSDSLYYSDYDSLIKMYYKPVLWPNETQITGKVILLKMDSNSIRQLIVPEDGLLVDQSGPDKAKMFNQIQGDSITGYFKNNKLHQLFAVPHGESIYFVTNDDDEYVGCSEASSREIEILFDTAGKIDRIFYRQAVKQTMTPIRDVEPDQKHLSRFEWLADLRPKDLKEFLKGATPPMEPEWWKEDEN